MFIYSPNGCALLIKIRKLSLLGLSGCVRSKSSVVLALYRFLFRGEHRLSDSRVLKEGVAKDVIFLIPFHQNLRGDLDNLSSLLGLSLTVVLGIFTCTFTS